MGVRDQEGHDGRIGQRLLAVLVVAALVTIVAPAAASSHPPPSSGTGDTACQWFAVGDQDYLCVAVADQDCTAVVYKADDYNDDHDDAGTTVVTNVGCDEKGVVIPPS